MNCNNLILNGCRNFTWEITIMLCSMMNMLAYQPKTFRAMTGAIKRGSRSIFPGGQFEVRHRFCQSSFEYGLAPIMSYDNFINVGQICESKFIAFNNGIDKMINLFAKFPMLRGTRLPFLNAIEAFFSNMDIEQAKTLAKHLSINYGWEHPWNKGNEGFWTFVTPCVNPSFYSVYDYDGVLTFQFIIIQLYGRYAVLPITMLRNNNYQHSILAHVPPAPPYSFFNEHALRQYPFAPVFLTDDIALAFENPPSSERIILVNIGGDAWIDDLNFSLLRMRREVTCVANNIDFPEYGIIRMIELLKAQGITPAIEQNPRLATTANIIL